MSETVRSAEDTAHPTGYTVTNLQSEHAGRVKDRRYSFETIF